MINSYYIDSSSLKTQYNIRFCFITSSYNQAEFITKNLESILLQDYKTYRIVYINDASTDNSLDILKKFIVDNPRTNMHLITNKKRLGPAGSRFVGCQEADNDEICVFLDGDDTLYSKDVLSIVAEVYQNPNIHATFGSMNNMKWLLSHQQLYTRRDERNFFPHLRTAKAYYCKQVPESYLKDKNNKWFMFCTDVALFTSIIELIDYNYVFIKNPLLIYNNYNSLNNPVEGFGNQNMQNRQKRKQYHDTIKSTGPLAPIIDNGMGHCHHTSKFLIIRILGNDLRGLHGSNQTFENLLFTLNHEPEFNGTDKMYILNRICLLYTSPSPRD